MSRTPNQIDRHIAHRLRMARERAGVSQGVAGAAIGVSFQQIQKYESGINRISVGALHGLAKFYAIEITWFFHGVDEAVLAAEAA
jgi:transcriptional regulator with XRE-family HTH domain